MKKYLYNILEEKKLPVPFHMPGHKRNEKFFLGEALKYDITEIDGYDNLHSPMEAIKNSQERCAKIFGAKKSFFLVNGSTSGIVSAILASVCENEKIIVARNCHKSVYSGIILTGANPVYIVPKIDKKLNIFLDIKEDDIVKVIKKNLDAKAVVITSPTYEGVISDIKKISKIVHKYNMLLIVDEAHGAHLGFHDGFYKSSITLGADIVIQSLHKTLPSLTQTALLHVCSNNVSNKQIGKIKQCLSIIQTTSPSYLFMYSIDKCLDFLENEKSLLFAKYVENLLKLRRKCTKLKNIQILNYDYKEEKDEFSLDISKLVFYTKYVGYCIVIYKRLLSDFNLQLEMSTDNVFIAMTSVADDFKNYDKLFLALKFLDENIEFSKNKSLEFKYDFKIAEKKISLKNAFNYKNVKSVLLEESFGNISSEFVILYPPGIPLVVPGEKISKKMIKLIKKYLQEGFSVIGTEDLTVSFINVCIIN